MAGPENERLMPILGRPASANPAIMSSRFCATYRPVWDMLTGEVYLTNEQRKKRWWQIQTNDCTRF